LFSRTADEGGLRYQYFYLRLRGAREFGRAGLSFGSTKTLDLCTSIAILTETAGKLRDKFNQADQDITDALKLISRASTVYKPSERVDILADAPDNRILECAIAAAADLIVTGDRHLLKLKNYQGILFYTTRGFITNVSKRA
jgi:putative PIN family toxin of toxin-antitoxin system